MNVTRARLRQVARPVLVTGGCGFLGCNLADALVARGQSVIALDSMARPGALENADWLKQRHGDRVAVERADIRDAEAVRAFVSECAGVLHLAAQVAVTTSLEHPLEDFEINTRGTLNVLEAVRQTNPRAPVIFASTHKVYGKLFGDAAVMRRDDRYVPSDERLANGVSEATPIDFCSPHACSKGGADQYVRDYARMFGLRTVVMRMSCIYGPRQFGTEDQGWVAHTLLRAIRREPITVHGDGYQVRDLLFVEDAVAAWLRALDDIDQVSGCIFNLGGGPQNTASLREMIALISELRGIKPELNFDPWRPSDQPWYVSDIRAIAKALDWAPRVGLHDGLRALDAWLDARFAHSATPPATLQEAHA
jgi:CDP-paratose 2-epimerase